jgi:tRNA/rRNA methyltransferase
MQPVVILVRPQLGDNIGAAARAMLNFGLTAMRLVAPRDGWPNPRAVAMASGATHVLDWAGVFPDVAAAIADCDYVLATTARNRDLVKPVLSPERAMATARAISAEGKRVGLLFGPERTGLENADLLFAKALVTVPVNPDFPSLNLAQCVLLLGYEWVRQGEPVVPEVLALAGRDLATPADLDRLAAHWEDRLEAAGFFFPPDKVAHQKESLRNMWGRLPLTRSEVQTFHGILKQIAHKLRGRDQDG